MHAIITFLSLFLFTCPSPAPCQETGKAETVQPAPTEQPVPAPISTEQPAPASPDIMSTLNDTLKLNVGDPIFYRVVEDKEDPVPLVVLETGEVEIPYLARIQAVGKTCKAFAYEVKQALEKDLYYHATVVIGIDLQRKSRGRITVVGKVGRAGTLEIPGGEIFTVSKAILAVGGFAEFASKSKVKIVRKTGPKPTDKQEIIVDVAAVLEKGELQKDQEVKSGDMIIVSERLINF